MFLLSLLNALYFMIRDDMLFSIEQLHPDAKSASGSDSSNAPNWRRYATLSPLSLRNSRGMDDAAGGERYHGKSEWSWIALNDHGKNVHDGTLIFGTFRRFIECRKKWGFLKWWGFHLEDNFLWRGPKKRDHQKPPTFRTSRQDIVTCRLLQHHKYSTRARTEADEMCPFRWIITSQSPYLN